MKYFAMVLRVLIILMWFHLMSIWLWTPGTAPFCSGVGFILIWVYLSLQSAVWPKALLCPLFHKCKSGSCEK